MYIVQYCKRYTESYNVQYCTSALQNMKNEYTECEELFIKVKGIAHWMLRRVLKVKMKTEILESWDFYFITEMYGEKN